MAYYDSIKLEKGMYSIGGKTFTQVLEEMDPSGQYEEHRSCWIGRLSASIEAV